MNSKSEPTKPRLPKATARQLKLLTKRLALAQELARTPTRTVTLRLPDGLNGWLDAYVHSSWPTRIRKQELLVEAMQLLIARRGGAREEVLAPELLAESPAKVMVR